jgi:hypothetical protein
MLNGKRCRNGKSTNIFVMKSKTVGKSRDSHSRFDIGFLKTNEIKLRSGATSFIPGFFTFIAIIPGNCLSWIDAKIGRYNAQPV